MKQLQWTICCLAALALGCGDSDDGIAETDTGVASADAGAVEPDGGEAFEDAGLVADAGDEPADAGEAVSDAGEGAADAAGAVDDAGEGVEDAGAILRDSGVVPRDTGVVVRDTGATRDTGVVPRDTGAARDTGVVRDSGVVPRDTGVVADAGAPANHACAVYNLMRSSCLGCHRNRGRGGFGLGNGTDGAIRDAFADTSSVGVLYVTPGNADRSYAYLRMVGRGNEIRGGTAALMPPGGGVPQASLNQLRDWINQGAPHAQCR